MDEFHIPKSPMEEEDDSRDQQLTLRSAPSFAIYNTNEEFGEDPEQVLMRTVTIGDSIEALGSDEFSFRKKEMDMIEEEEENEKEDLFGIQNQIVEEEAERPASPPMYLATGLGVDRNDGGVRLDSHESSDLEEDYRRLVDEYPNHPLFLRNYAQLLQSKGDLHTAEEYFLRATLADPDDGEISMEYAKLVWELYHDKQRALHYFQQAVQAAPQDNHILAAYASFLWEIEDDEEESGKLETNSENDEEDYYKKMIDEDPTNPLFLKNYALFLMQSKGNLHGAEDYFLRAIQEDPEDGEILMQYAKLAWELHHDKDRALHYFEQAAQVSPQDSYVLAAYASFLWETEDDEEGEKQETNSKDNEEGHQIELVKPSQEGTEPVSLFSHVETGQEINAVDLTAAYYGKHGNVEADYRKMIDENPTNPLFLKIYARFLVQSKKDLEAAEEYYSRAILADPGDGEILSEYAQLVWERHHDQEKASLYFEQAVQASPRDSHVLAAYACFLWKTEDGEAEI